VIGIKDTIHILKAFNRKKRMEGSIPFVPEMLSPFQARPQNNLR
jgi:hypothetical protein